MKSTFPSLLVSLLLSLLVQVSGLELLLQPQTVAGGTSVVFYTRDPSDPPSFTFDLHFTAPDGTTIVDKGLAYPKISVSPGQTTGVVPIVFPSSGTYTVQAVIPQNGKNIVISSSNPVQVVTPSVPVTPVPIIPPVPGPQTPLVPPTQTPVVPPPTPFVPPPPVTVSTSQSTTSVNVSPTPSTTSVSTTSPTPTTTSLATTSSPTTSHATSTRPATTSSSHSHTHTSSAPTLHPTAAGNQQKPSVSQRKVNLPAVVGGVVGGLVFLGLVAALVVFLIRRKKAAAKRYTFHQDMMVQPRNDDDPSVPRVTVLRGPGESTSSFDRDLESGPPVEPVSMTAPVPQPVSSVVPATAPATATLPKRVPSGPKKLILASSIAPSPSVRVRQERERAQSPVTPRTKRNFPTVTSNPFNTEAEGMNSPGPVPSTPRTGIPAALTPAGFPTPSVPSSYRIEPFDPFQDYYKSEPEMTQVPPSPRIPSSAVVVPSPRGPRPSISGKRPVLAAASDSSSSSHGAV